jgi:serine/threonine-protein kinase RIO1
VDSDAGKKRRKLLLKWVCSTIILSFVGLSDYTIGFFPTYSFWRGIIFTMMLYDGSIATKMMMVFEKHIESVEKWVDKIVHAVCSVYNLVYFPMFIFLIDKLDFVVSGSDEAQLKDIEKLVKNFKTNIRKARITLAPPKPGESPRAVIKTKKRTMNTPLRAAAAKTWKAEVKILKTSSIGKKTFFPHTLSYDFKSNTLTWQAAGDDKASSDTVVGVRLRDNSKHILEIQLEAGSKTVSFASSEQSDEWLKFLEAQC